MKIDPNSAVETHAEYVLCDGGAVTLHDGRATPLAHLGDGGSAFADFCRTLDPNKCFVVALIPNEDDKPVFFRAREVAKAAGLHVQAPVETADRLRQHWESYLLLKRMPTATNDADDEAEIFAD